MHCFAALHLFLHVFVAKMPWSTPTGLLLTAAYSCSLAPKALSIRNLKEITVECCTAHSTQLQLPPGLGNEAPLSGSGEMKAMQFPCSHFLQLVMQIKMSKPHARGRRKQRQCGSHSSVPNQTNSFLSVLKTWLPSVSPVTQDDTTKLALNSAMLKQLNSS